MTSLDELLVSVERGALPAALPAPLQALWHDARGDWQRAHEIVQAENSPESAWVHAYLHRKEGDPGNAAYWYRRAGRSVSDNTLEDEWRSIASELITRGGAR